MRLFLGLLIIGLMVAVLTLGQSALAHDCPLQEMGRLETFRALDKDQDGRLSLMEFMAQGWCQQATPCQCQAAARQFFQCLDQNGDGYITLEEHQALNAGKQRRPQ